MDLLTPSTPLRGRPRRSWVFDVVVTLGVGATWLVTAASNSGPVVLPDLVVGIVGAALVLPLLVRRVWPVPVFALLYAVGAVAGWWLHYSVFSATYLVALYTVAANRPRRETLACAGALVVATTVWSWHVTEQPDQEWPFAAVFLAVVVGAVTAFGLYIHTRRALLLELQERAVRLEHERDQQGELAAAAERARIAREMHDVVAHHLTVMVALADGAAAQATRTPQQAERAMRTVSATGRQALTDTRRLLGVLREAAVAGAEPVRSPLPGLAELDDLVTGVRAAGLPVRYEVEGERPELDTGTQLAVFRLVQEALTNTMKHAGTGASACVRLGFRPDEIRVDVSDDGRGTGAPSAGGRGLSGMRERMAAVGGRVTSGPGPAGGWHVAARVPTTTGGGAA
ncbi:sensor histidine kinase [Jatrophihabitans fulvus]